MSTTLEFMTKLPVKITKRKKWILASCPLLDIHSQGENEKLAKQSLSEAISLFFVSCFERGTLDDVLKECGFELRRTIGIVKRSQPKGNYIDIPLSFQYVRQKRGAECRA